MFDNLACMKGKFELKKCCFLCQLRFILSLILAFTFSTFVKAQIPNLDWATYHGGSNEDGFRDMATDAFGNVYVVGSTRSSNAIGTPASFQSMIAGGSDVYLAKYNTDGNKIWTTYYGGSEDDIGQSIDLDANGNIFITGLSFSTNGIATFGTHQISNNGNGDTFLAKFNNNGFRIWGTYLGGENFDFANDIEIDNSGNPIIIGWTNSTNNISTLGAFQDTYRGQDDILLAKFDTNGLLQWSTYYGDIGFDTGLQVESDVVGNIIISGWTSSPTNIATPGVIQTIYGGSTADVFLAVFNISGNRIWATYFGGSGNDYSDALFVTASGDIYLSGSTDSPNNIATPSAYQPNVVAGYDTFLARFSASGSISWSTYFGGNNNDTAYRLRVGTDGGIYIVGHTFSTDVMATSGAFQINKSGGQDVFLSKFETNGSLVWSTYYGGIANDFGYGLVLNANDDIFINGNTEGSTNLSTMGVVQENFGGGLQDGFIAKFAPCVVPELNFTNSGFTCAPINYIFEFELIGQPPFTIYYNIDGVAQPPWVTNNANFFPTIDADLWTDIIQIDSVKSGNCKGTINSTFGYVQVRDSIRATSPIISCDYVTSTYTVTVDLSGGAFGSFSSVGTNGGFINNSTQQFVSFPILFNDPYFVQFTESGTFSNCDTLSFQGISNCIDPCPPLSINLTSNSPVCVGSSLSLMANGGVTYQWQGPNGFVSIEQNPIIDNVSIINGGSYVVTVTDANGCSGTAMTNIIINLPASGGLSSNSPVCNGTEIRLNAFGGIEYVWAGPNSFTSSLANPIITNATIINSGTYFLTVTDMFGCVKAVSIDVIVSGPLNVQISSNSPICEGTDLNLVASGGSFYQWSGPNGYINNQQNPIINNATNQNAGTYTVTVTGANGCTEISSTSVSISSSTSVNISSNSPVCVGSMIVIMASGGSIYSWSGPNGFSSNVPNPAINNATISNAGTYQLTITDINGCISSSNVSIVVNEAPMAILTSNSPICRGDDITFQLSVATSYIWQGPNNFTSIVQNPIIPNASDVNNGTYTVIVTDQNGCTASVSTVVNIIIPGNVIVSSNSPICEQDTLRLWANEGISFEWLGPKGFTSTSQNPIITSTNTSSSGLYILTVSDVTGCSSTMTIMVEVKERPVAAITGDQEICAGEELTLQSPNVGNLLWSTDEVTSSITVIPLISSIFTLTVDLNGCVDTAYYPILVKPKPFLALNLIMASITKGESIQLIASGAQTYEWTPDIDLTCSDCSNPIATPMETTTYCVESMLNGCTFDTCVHITVLDDCLFELPNIFTPNGDGLNDFWCSKIQDCVVAQTLNIYDRWGNLLHTQSGPEVCWAGGNELQNNVYTFILRKIRIDGKEEYITGNITLIR